MEVVKIILQISGFLGISSLFTLYITERIKNKIKNSFDIKLEEVKMINSKEISQFQSELNHLKSKESFKFTKLHEKRFEVMAETYKYLTDALFKLRIYVAPLKGVPTDKTAEEINYTQFTDYSNAHNKFYEYYSFNKIYFCLLYTSPSPRDLSTSRMPSSA